MLDAKGHNCFYARNCLELNFTYTNQNQERECDLKLGVPHTYEVTELAVNTSLISRSQPSLMYQISPAISPFLLTC